MRERKRTPAVPLEAGAGPENPPCPACGEPLFGWVGERPGLAGPARRCEVCGLGAVGEPGEAEEALRELERQLGERGGAIANRAGASASLGGAGWAGLAPGARYLFTPDAARRLLARRHRVVTSARWAPFQGLAAMWQTLLNSATFGHNVAFAARRRSFARYSGGKEQRGALAARRWQRRIDWLTTVVLALPALAVAVPLELAGALLGRGSVLLVRSERL